MGASYPRVTIFTNGGAKIVGTLIGGSPLADHPPNDITPIDPINPIPDDTVKEGPRATIYQDYIPASGSTYIWYANAGGEVGGNADTGFHLKVKDLALDSNTDTVNIACVKLGFIDAISGPDDVVNAIFAFKANKPLIP